MTDSAAQVSGTAPAPAPGSLRALGGIWRLTYPAFLTGRRMLLLAGLLGLLCLLTVQTVNRGHTMEFYRWTTGFYLTILLPAIAFLSSAGAMRDDMRPVAVDYVLTRPVRRPVLVLFRYLSQMACLQLTSLLALAALCLVGWSVDVSGLGAMLPHLLLAQVLAVAGFSALGFLFGALTSRYLALGLLYGLLVEIGVGQIPTQVSRLSMSHHILAMLSPVVPDARGTHAAESAFAAGGAILVFMLIALAGTIVVFLLREFTGSGAAEK